MKQPVNNTLPLVDTRPDGGHVAYARPDEVQGSPFDVATPGANLPATVSYGPQQQTVHAIAGVAWSYGAAPTGGNLQVIDNPGNLLFSTDITAGGPGSVLFNPPIACGAGRGLTVTLAAGSGTVVGKLSVLGHRAVQLPVGSGPNMNFSQASDSQYVPLV